MIKKLILKITAIVFIIGLVYTAYNFIKTYNGIQAVKQEFGYDVPAENLPTQSFKQGNWTGILIDSDIRYTDGAHNLVPYDLDNDGKAELIGASFRSDALILYTCDNDMYNSVHWSRHVIDVSVGEGIPRRPVINFIMSLAKEKLLGGYTGGAHYPAIADINGDGRADIIVAADLKRYDVVWYETPEKITNIMSWKKHLLYSDDTHRTYHVETGDIDSDGDQDIVIATKTDNSLGWLENTGFKSNWPCTIIDTQCIRCFNARVADINNDGKCEIIASEDNWKANGKLYLYTYSENPRHKESWERFAIGVFPTLHGVNVFEIIDLDKDGDYDITVGNHQGDVYILENPYPETIQSEWRRHKVTANLPGSGHDFREIDVGDIDSDGDNDIIVADEGQNMIIWFENSGTLFTGSWISHIIDTSDQYLKWCHSVELNDIDGDGNLDVAVAAAGSNTFFIYFNFLM